MTEMEGGDCAMALPMMADDVVLLSADNDVMAKLPTVDDC